MNNNNVTRQIGVQLHQHMRRGPPKQKCAYHSTQNEDSEDGCPSHNKRKVGVHPDGTFVHSQNNPTLKQCQVKLFN